MPEESVLRARKAVKVTIVGLIANIILTVFKIIAGVLGTSAAMIADGVHSLSDLVTDFVVLIGIRLGSKPSDSSHPYGHGRFETFATLIIAVILVSVAYGILSNGVKAVYEVLVNGHVIAKPGLIALVMAFISIAVKESLYQYTAVVGRSINSDAVISNAWHHRGDALSSIATLIGIGGAYFLGHKWTVLDPVAAILVSIFIFIIGFRILAGAVREMLDASLPPESIEKIKQICNSVAGVSQPHNIRTRKIGYRISIDLHIKLTADTPFKEVHHKMHEVEDLLRAEFGRDTFIIIHPEPIRFN